MPYRCQEPPNAVQVELVEGCNLYCNFCGLQGIREKKEKNYKFADPIMLARLFTQMHELKWQSRVEFAMHGEPSLHPYRVEIIQYARNMLGPKASIMMTSNGGGLIGGNRGTVQNVIDLFDAGLNILALDDYDDAKIVSKIRGLVAHVNATGVQVYEYPDNPLGNPHTRTKPGARILSFVRDPSRAVNGTHAKLNNHCGAAAPPNEDAAGKRCAKPFRELSVRWDGNVALCCNDWRGEYKCGNVVTDGLDAVWQSDAFGAAREHLYQGKRTFTPCKGCDATSYRVGLLPDKLGRDTLKEPDEQSFTDIANALSEGTYTAPVLRKWE